MTKPNLLAAALALVLTAVTFHQAIAIPAPATTPIMAQQLLA
ncbi:hypothetical protein [Tsuneonella flava]|nr:hypothetical protein [Tsuneonella flava]